MDIAQLAKPGGLGSMKTKPFRVSESLRALRTHVMARHVSEGHRALAVCAASKGSGCTFVAANLAAALSQIGVNTLLLDADLRSPGVSATLGLEWTKPDLSHGAVDANRFQRLHRTQCHAGPLGSASRRLRAATRRSCWPARVSKA